MGTEGGCRYEKYFRSGIPRVGYLDAKLRVRVKVKGRMWGARGRRMCHKEQPTPVLGHIKGPHKGSQRVHTASKQEPQSRQEGWVAGSHRKCVASERKREVSP